MTGCGSFTGVGCQTPVLGHGVTSSPVVPHLAVAHQAITSGGLPMTGADIATIAFFGAATVLAGALAMVGGKKKGPIE